MIMRAKSRPRRHFSHAHFRHRQSMISPEVRRRADATSAIEKFHFREREQRRGKQQKRVECGPRSAAARRSARRSVCVPVNSVSE